MHNRLLSTKRLVEAWNGVLFNLQVEIFEFHFFIYHLFHMLNFPFLSPMVLQ